MFSSGALGCLALTVRHVDNTYQHALLPAQPCEARRSSHTLGLAYCSRTTMANLIVASLQGGLPMCIAGKTSWNRTPSDSLGRVFLHRTPLPQFEVVAFPQVLLQFGKNQSVWAGVCSEFHPVALHIDKIQDWICSLSLTPVIYGHASDLLDCPPLNLGCANHCYRLQSGSQKPSRATFCMTDTAAAVTLMWVSQSIWHAPQPGHSQQGIHIDIGLPFPIIQLKIVVGQAGHPSVTCSIQLGLWLIHRSGNCCLYRHQKLICRGTHEISQLQPIWGQEIPNCGQGSEIWPM